MDGQDEIDQAFQSAQDGGRTGWVDLLALQDTDGGSEKNAGDFRDDVESGRIHPFLYDNLGDEVLSDHLVPRVKEGNQESGPKGSPPPKVAEGGLEKFDTWLKVGPNRFAGWFFFSCSQDVG